MIQLIEPLAGYISARIMTPNGPRTLEDIAISHWPAEKEVQITFGVPDPDDWGSGEMSPESFNRAFFKDLGHAGRKMQRASNFFYHLMNMYPNLEFEYEDLNVHFSLPETEFKGLELLL